MIHAVRQIIALLIAPWLDPRPARLELVAERAARAGEQAERAQLTRMWTATSERLTEERDAMRQEMIA